MTNVLDQKYLIIFHSPDLFWDMRKIPGLETEITISEPGDLEVFGHVDFQNRKLIKPTIGVACDVTLNGYQLYGTKTGENISWDRHYWNWPVHAFYPNLWPGTHKIELRARAYSTAAPNKNGLAEVKGGYNNVIVRVTKAAGKW